MARYQINTHHQGTTMQHPTCPAPPDRTAFSVFKKNSLLVQRSLSICLYVGDQVFGIWQRPELAVRLEWARASRRQTARALSILCDSANFAASFVVEAVASSLCSAKASTSTVLHCTVYFSSSYYTAPWSSSTCHAGSGMHGWCFEAFSNYSDNLQIQCSTTHTLFKLSTKLGITQNNER